MPATWYSFGSFVLDCKNGLLFEKDVQLHLRPKVLAVLRILLEHAGNLVDRARLLEMVWPELDVQPKVLDSAVTELRRLLRLRSPGVQFIEGSRGRGFRFVAPVRASERKPLAHAEASPPGAPASPFFGRESVLDEIRAAVSDAQRSHIVFVCGAAGIGKTRLMQEALRAVAAHEINTISIALVDSDRQVELAMWARIIESIADGMPPAEMQAALGWAATDIGVIAPRVCPANRPREGAPLDPAVARSRLFSGMIHLFKNLTARSPQLLAIDDLHKATGAGLALLETVIDACADEPLVVLAGLRTHELNSAVADFVQRQQAKASATTVVQLEGLSRLAVRQLIDVHALQLPVETVSAIIKATQGNPFFVHQVMEALQAQGRTAANDVPYQVPRTLRRVVDSRIDALGSAARELLTVAAIAGESFDVPVVAAATTVARAQIATLLEQARAAGIVSEDVEVGRMRFCHDVFRDTLLHELPPGDRQPIHARLGASIESMHGARVGTWAQLAYHFSEAGAEGDPLKTFTYCLQAGEHALQTYADENASRLLDCAARLVDTVSLDEVQKFRLYEAHAEAAIRMGQHDLARNIVRELFLRAAARGETERMARAAITGTRAYFPFQPNFMSREQLEFLDEAWRCFPPEPSLLRGLLAARLGFALLGVPHSDERRIGMGRQAVAIAHVLSSADQRAQVLQDSIWAFWDADHLDDRMALVAELKELRDRFALHQLDDSVYGWTALHLLVRGQLRELTELLAKSPPLFREVPHAIGGPYPLRLQIMIAMLQGDLETMRQRVDDLACMAGDIPQIAEFQLPMARGLVNRELGQEGGTLPLLSAIAQHLPLDIRVYLPFFLFQSGRIEEAKAALEDRMRDRFWVEDRRESIGWLQSVFLVGEACALLEVRSAAETLYDLLRPYADQWAVLHLAWTVLGCMNRVLGRLADVIGNEPAMRSHFEAGIRQCRQEGALGELARLEVDFAQALRRRDPNSDEARALLADALAIADAHGLAGIHKRAVRSQG